MVLRVGGYAVIEGGLVQLDLEQLNTDKAFSLCTACGDVFVIQVRGAHLDTVDVTGRSGVTRGCGRADRPG